MEIRYWAPLERAWARMKGMLFNPFDLGKWLVIAFSAWLASLAGGGGGGGMRFNPRRDHVASLHVRRSLREAWSFLQSHPAWRTWIILGVAALVALGLVLVWISSRGKFVFLDNVAHDRARIADPWRRYARVADSLFAWRLCFLLACLAAIAALAATAWAAAGGPSGFGFGSARAIAITVVAGFALVMVGIACAYVSLFLDGFIVPIMYKNEIGAVEAWRRFAPWLERHLGAFLLYGLFVLGLFVVVGAGVVAVGLMTCCVGLLLVILPYVGTVVLLPFIVTYRALSVEFLGQFDAAFLVFPQPAAAQPSPAQASP